MSSYLELILDTTATEIENISVPQYVAYDDKTYMNILCTSNDIGGYSITLTDSGGNIKELTFIINNNKINGILDVVGLRSGMCTLSVRIYDGVNNKSNVYNENFLIYEQEINLKVSVSQFENIISDMSQFENKLFNIMYNNQINNLEYSDIVNTNTMVNKISTVEYKNIMEESIID